ncbi:hypothetical protein ABIB40_003096 [Pedobacter sp. UYP30]|uniref:DUF7822 domain-containing protein n=1 Tax=Pedobacter sp. UYP30 TaxID=1756400 RepID=UPI0033911EED
MANRSFIYTTNSYQDSTTGATGLSEYPYEVHPLYLLIVSCDSEMILSKVNLGEDKTAIVGDFEKGKSLVLQFLDLILNYDDSFKNDTFEAFVKKGNEILNQHNEKYVILENFEIVELSGTNFVPETFKDLGVVKQEVEELYLKHLGGNLTLEDIRETSIYNDFEDVSIKWGQVELEDVDWSDFWTDSIYYSF